MKKAGVDATRLWEDWRNYNDNNFHILQLNKQLNYYWTLLSACVERYSFAELLQPQKQHLQNLLKTGDYEILAKELKDFSNAVCLYLENNIALSIDPELDKMLILLFNNTGNQSVSKKYKRLIDAQKWNSITMFESK